MDAEKTLQRELKQHGFKLVRQDRHLIYKNESGRIFVTPATPSDQRWAFNALSDLRRIVAEPPRSEMLSIIEVDKREEAIRLERQEKQQAARPGMGSGKQHRSNGTGYKYYDRILTEEEINQRKLAAEKAKENHEQRRQRKLERKATIQAKRNAEQKEALLWHINQMLERVMPPPPFLVTVYFANSIEQTLLAHTVDQLAEQMLFASTVEQFADSFGRLEWEEIEADNPVEITIHDAKPGFVGTKVMTTVTNLRRQTYEKKYFNQKLLPDGTKIVQHVEFSSGNQAFNKKTLPDGTEIMERFEWSDGTKAFNQIVFPDGTLTMERIEYPNEDKNFNRKISPDGTVFDERSEQGNITYFNQKTLPDRTFSVERTERPDAITFNETNYPDGSHTCERIEDSQGNKHFNIKLLPDGTWTKERIEWANGTKWFNIRGQDDSKLRFVEWIEHPDGTVERNVKLEVGEDGNLRPAAPKQKPFQRRLTRNGVAMAGAREFDPALAFIKQSRGD